MTDKWLDQAKDTLKAKKADMRCSEVIEILERLGFAVKSGKSPGHKVYSHTELPEFYTSSFNCNHGKNPQIKPAYITNILRVLGLHESALRAHLKGDKK